MEQEKSRWLSKISWGGLVISLVGVGVAVGVIPEDQQEAIVSAVMTIGGALIVVWRQFFTDKLLK